METYSIKAAAQLNKLLGYRGLKSFATLYNGGSKNAWGYPDASMHTLKHEFYSDWADSNKPVETDKIRFVATHTTYFKVTPETARLNKWLEANGPATVTECITYLNTK